MQRDCTDPNQSAAHAYERWCRCRAAVTWSSETEPLEVEERRVRRLGGWRTPSAALSDQYFLRHPRGKPGLTVLHQI